MNILVLGAGPAGCSAAISLANLGHRVTIIDRKTFPRDKICGDAISPGCLSALQLLNIGTDDLEDECSELQQIFYTKMNFQNLSVSYSGGSYGFCIPRYVFDYFLFSKMLSNGVVFQKGSVLQVFPNRRQVIIRNEGRCSKMTGDFIVDARGAYAGTPNSLGLRSYWEIKKSQFSESMSKTILFSLFSGGYGWVFPVHTKQDHFRLNVGLGYYQKSKFKKNSYSGYFESLKQQDMLTPFLKDLVTEENMKGCFLALGLWRNTVAEKGVLKIGDAANLTDPLTGEGIGNAILSGVYVANIIHRHPDSADVTWQKTYQKYFQRDFRAALFLRRMLSSPFLLKGLIHGMKEYPGLNHKVNLALTGLARYIDLPWIRSNFGDSDVSSFVPKPDHLLLRKP